jgi:hypothetical protein
MRDKNKIYIIIYKSLIGFTMFDDDSFFFFFQTFKKTTKYILIKYFSL